MKKFLPHLLAFIIIFSIGHSVVSAQGTGCDPSTGSGCSSSGSGISTTIPNPFNCGGATNCTLDVFLTSIVHNIILPVGGVLAVLAFIWVGFMYVKARGKPGEIETANRALLYVAIGTAILLGAEIISSVVSNTLTQLK